MGGSISHSTAPEQFRVSEHDGKMRQGFVVVVRNRNKLGKLAMV